MVRSFVFGVIDALIKYVDGIIFDCVPFLVLFICLSSIVRLIIITAGPHNTLTTKSSNLC